MWTLADRALVGDFGSGQALTDDQFRLVEPFIPPAKAGGRPRITDVRRLLDGLFYLVRTGCQWRHLPLPPAFPPWDRVAWVGGVDAMSPTRVSGHAMRTYSGRPRSSMRFRTSAAIATSVAWRPSVCDRSPSPMTRFQRETSDSTTARRLYPDDLCQPMRPRSAMASMCLSRRVGAVPAVSLGTAPDGTAPERGGTTTAASGCRAATPAWTSSRS